MNDSSPDLAHWLASTRERLGAWLAVHASGVLRFEAVDDLIQSIHLRALNSREGFVWQGEAAFTAWLFTLAQRHVADRHEYWSALKRGSGKVLRLSYGNSEERSRAPRALLAPGPSPGSFAARRELLVIAARALQVLPKRDRLLVKWSSEGVELQEQAERLGLSYAAAQRSRLRAIERFRKSFELVSRAQ